MRHKRFGIVALLLIGGLPMPILADSQACPTSAAGCIDSAPVLQLATAPRPLAPDYGADARQQAEAQRQRDTLPPSRMAVPAQSWGQQQGTQPVYRESPGANKLRACEDNWSAVQTLDAAARVNASDALRMERQRLLDVRWRLGC